MKNKNLKIIIIVSIVIPSLILISTVGLNADRNDFPASHFSLETITVGSFPIGISINPITNIVYVANNHSDTVSVIDGKTNLVKDEIKVGDGPTGISVNPKTNMIYVTNYYSDTVSVIDGKTNLVVKEIPVDNTPWGIDVDSGNNIIYKTNYLSNTISIIDEAKDGIVTTVKTDKPWGIDVDSGTGYVFVANRDSTNISALKNGQIENITISETPVRINPYDVSYNEKTNLLYVTNTNLISVIDISTNKILEPISVGKNLSGIGINANTNMIYATDIVKDVLYVIDGSTNMIKDEIKVGDHPILLEVNPKTNTIYVVNEYSNSIFSNK